MTGRPTTYTAESDRIAYNACMLGATNAQLADTFGVTETTIENWLRKHPSFFRSVHKGRDGADQRIAKALYHRAKGYSHPEDKIFIHEGEPVVVPTTKHYPPDTAAAFIWLKNRHPDRWRDRKEVQHGGKVDIGKTEDDGLVAERLNALVQANREGSAN